MNWQLLHIHTVIALHKLNHASLEATELLFASLPCALRIVNDYGFVLQKPEI